MESFNCPITHAQMVSPVICEDGNTYEEVAIRRWIDENAENNRVRSPLTGEQIGCILIPNRALRDAIVEYTERQELPVTSEMDVSTENITGYDVPIDQDQDQNQEINVGDIMRNIREDYNSARRDSEFNTNANNSNLIMTPDIYWNTRHNINPNIIHNIINDNQRNIIMNT